jgi:diguanylate cyclase (GGDEF)-like protein
VSDVVASLAAKTAQYRRRYLLFVSVQGLISALILAPLLHLWGLDGTSFACLLYIPVCIVVIWGSLRSQQRLDVFVSLYIFATLLVTLAGIYFQGSVAYGDPWILICPAVAFAICKRRVATGWTLLTLLALFIVRGVELYPFPLASTVFLALAIICIATLLYQFSAQIEKNESLIIELGNTDSLTNTLNRRSFHKVLQDEFRRNHRHSTSMTVLMVDVDYFKLYNDHYGHVLGDGVLVGIAKTLKQTAKRAGDFVFRYGGEEFCILCSGLEAAQAAAFAETLRANVEALALKHEHSPIGRISVSIGYRHSGTLAPLTPEIFVEEADKVLYRAKANGRNRVESYAETDASAADGTAVGAGVSV